MARMYPNIFEKNENYKPESHEDLIYQALSKLPDDYFVLYSVSNTYSSPIKKEIYNSDTNSIILEDTHINRDGETDFIIFHPDKGLIGIEAKYTKEYRIENGYWYYYDPINDKKTPMHHGKGPYVQVNDNFVNPLKHMHEDDNFFRQIKDRMVYTKIIWFHGTDFELINKIKPIEDPQLHYTFSKEDLNLSSEELTKKIEEVFNHAKSGINSKGLNQKETNDMLFYLGINRTIRVSNFREDRKKMFIDLTNEQYQILNLLQYQNEVCIQGLGGTGKTTLAIRKAEMESSKGKVLFLCFNKYLISFLISSYEHCGEKIPENIDFFNLHSFREVAKRIMNINTMNFSCIKDYIESEQFPYRSVIIDEAQDFPQNDEQIAIDIDDMFESLRNKIKKTNGSLYVFYDKCQCIQSNAELLPSIIQNPLCLISLVINCRNTIEIKDTSIGLLKTAQENRTIPNIGRGKDPLGFNKLTNREIHGSIPNLIQIKSEDEFKKTLNQCINEFIEFGINPSEITILSLKTEEKSILTSKCKSKLFMENEMQYYCYDNKKYLFTTVRKFKGLESDAVIIIDFDDKTIDLNFKNEFEKGIYLFYVGCSRAINKLAIIGMIDPLNLKELLINQYGQSISPNMTRKLCEILALQSK